MFKILLYILLAWFLYNLIFRFIIPVYRASRQMRKQFRQVQEQFQEAARQQQQSAQASQTHQASSAQPAPHAPGDYIEFEEIK
jgi:Sec-independent protein translocase protein TatA